MNTVKLINYPYKIIHQILSSQSSRTFHKGNMKQIVECVPNFSEGRNKTVIDAIAESIRNVKGVRLLDVDPGASTNRTVYTFVGGPDDVIEGALAGAKKAFHLIDMTKHKGEHPRMGALDVCPFIPVLGITVEECVALSKKFGKLLAESLNVPVYLYGEASQVDYRKTMPQIRFGEYEGLENKLKLPEWLPNFGEPIFVPTWGATVTGVRKFLIAYNINLVSTKEQAHRIALNLREQGRGPDNVGRLKNCQGIGWYLEERNIAQISLNLTDYHVTPMHIAYEEAKKDAEELKIPVTGSEIVGLIPLDSILMAANYYIEKENLFILEEEQKVHLAINRLGLSTLSPFDPKERIIEYCLDKQEGELAQSTTAELIRKVAARTAAPGGGSVAAVVGSLGSALGSMVGKLTYGKRQWEHLDTQMRDAIPLLHNTSEQMISLIDEDTNAFSEYMAALKLPSSTEEQTSLKLKQVEDATKRTVEVPLGLMKAISPLWKNMETIAELGNINCKSDVQVGVRCLETGSWGAYYNVLVNLPNITDENERQALRKEAEMLLEISTTKCKKVLQIIEHRS